MADIKWTHLTETLNLFADYFIETARQNLSNNGSNASYNLFDSFEKIVEVGDDYYSVKISLADYFKFVENGRGPGKFPPVDKIREWISVKPITPYPGKNGKIPSVEQLSFLIGRKIATEGTDPQPFFEPAKEDAISRFEEAINLAISEDIDNWIIGELDARLFDI